MLRPKRRGVGMKDEEVLHPGHRSIRLKELDYAAPAFYFITICATEKRCIFGAIRENHIDPSPLGRIVRDCWMSIAPHFPQVNLHAFVLMPNHVHGIIEIARQAGAQLAAPRPGNSLAAFRVKPGSLGAIVRSFKSAVTKKTHAELHWQPDIWQRNYFERVLRDAKEIANAHRYIAENPMMWSLDQENPEKQINI